MATVNDIESSHSGGIRTAVSKTAEDEAEAAGDDERTADLINASILTGKLQTPKRDQSNSIIERAKRVIKSAGMAARGLVQIDVGHAHGRNKINNGNPFSPEGETISEDSQAIMMDLDNRSDIEGEEIEAEERSESASSTSANANKRKPDIYDPDPDPQQLGEGEEVDEHAQKPAKRTRISKKAKSPLLSPMVRQPTTTQRQTRAKTRAESETVYRVASQLGKDAGTDPVPSQKRGRGRPRKSKVSKPGNDEEESAAPEHGIRDIQMDPSPAKPSLPVAKGWHSNRQISRPRSRSRDIHAGQAPGEDDEEGEDEQGDGEGKSQNEDSTNNDRAPDFPDDYGQEDMKLPATIKDIISVEQVEKMLEKIRTTGKKVDKATGGRTVERPVQAPKSAPGKRMMMSLKKLIKTYDALNTSRVAGTDTAQTKQAEAAELIENLEKEAESIFLEMFPTNSHGVPQRTPAAVRIILRDIHCLLVPNLTKTLKLAVEAYQDEDLSETGVIKQVTDILGLLQDVGAAALRQPPSGTQLENTSQPIGEISLKIHKLLAAIQRELKRRASVKKTEVWKAGAAERQRRRAAEHEREYREQRRRMNEIYRMQQEVMNAKLNHPLYGQYLRAELEREEARSVEMQVTSSSTQRSTPQDFHDHNDDPYILNDPFADQHEPVARMTPLLISTNGRRPFGTNNAGNNRASKPLSREEKKILINTMRFEDKELRYELAAERLGRSMDEIFLLAQDLQVCFDNLHENGEMNRVQDEWTYDIWVK